MSAKKNCNTKIITLITLILSTYLFYSMYFKTFL